MPPVLKVNPITGQEFLVEPEDLEEFDRQVAAAQQKGSMVAPSPVPAPDVAEIMQQEIDPEIAEFTRRLAEDRAAKEAELSQRLASRSQAEQMGLGLYGMARGATGGWLPEMTGYINP